MPWFKVDDHFWSHPKVSTLSADAISLWVRAGSYSAQHLTDGFIPEPTIVRQLWSSLAAAGELVDCGLWSSVAGGFQFHDWLEYQPTAESTIAKRDAAKERMRLVREKRPERSREQDANVRANEERSSREQDANVRANKERSSREVRLTPNPNPNPNPNPSPNGDIKPRKRGSRLPDDFTIDDDMRAWATEHVPSLDIDSVFEEFRDYWSAQPGQKGVKTDWVATWRNGMRKQAEWRARRQPTSRSGSHVDAIAELREMENAAFGSGHAHPVRQLR